MLAAETALAADASIVLTVSEAEASAFRKSVNGDVRILGHALTAKPTIPSFKERSDILFVGALEEEDSPNVDSLLWFVRKVMPLLDDLLVSSYRLVAVGRISSQIVKQLAGPRVCLLGKRENIEEFYAKSRIFIAPTRYAAGLPMKVHESASAGLPVVATSLLATQLDWKDGDEILVADDPEKFAFACYRLYSNEELWTTVRKNALERIGRDCSPSAFSACVASVLTQVRRAVV
jgi:glycosyltransferase involved in cell wall biosynthesis